MVCYAYVLFQALQLAIVKVKQFHSFSSQKRGRPDLWMENILNLIFTGWISTGFLSSFLIFHDRFERTLALYSQFCNCAVYLAIVFSRDPVSPGMSPIFCSFVTLN